MEKIELAKRMLENYVDAAEQLKDDSWKSFLKDDSEANLSNYGRRCGRLGAYRTALDTINTIIEGEQE